MNKLILFYFITNLLIYYRIHLKVIVIIVWINIVMFTNFINLFYLLSNLKLSMVLSKLLWKLFNYKSSFPCLCQIVGMGAAAASISAIAQLSDQKTASNGNFVGIIGVFAALAASLATAYMQNPQAYTIEVI